MAYARNLFMVTWLLLHLSIFDLIDVFDMLMLPPGPFGQAGSRTSTTVTTTAGKPMAGGCGGVRNGTADGVDQANVTRVKVSDYFTRFYSLVFVDC